MDYNELENFIHKKMKMAHIYQPIMIKTLLESKDNAATVDDIARKFLNNNEKQLDYYKKITRHWPDSVLRKHKVIDYKENVYTLQLDEKISRNERKRLKELCDLRLKEHVDGDKWIKAFRKFERVSVSDSLRLYILAKSRGVCVECGVKTREAMLHVDHIIPRSRGGKTDPGNLQALCRKCDTEKKNYDDLEFLKWRTRFKESKKPKCRICNGVITGMMPNGMAHATFPEHPIAEMHTFVIPNRHVGSFRDLIPAERQLCLNLIDDVIAHLKRETVAEKFNVTGFDKKMDHFHIDVVPVLDMLGQTPRQ